MFVLPNLAAFSDLAIQMTISEFLSLFVTEKLKPLGLNLRVSSLRVCVPDFCPDFKYLLNTAVCPVLAWPSDEIWYSC
jgi:hypothetical protein